MTSLGRLMVEFPLPPGLTRALLRSAALGCEEVMLPVAAMLSVENILIRPGRHFCTRAVFTVLTSVLITVCIVHFVH